MQQGGLVVTDKDDDMVRIVEPGNPNGWLEIDVLYDAKKAR